MKLLRTLGHRFKNYFNSNSTSESITQHDSSMGSATGNSQVTPADLGPLTEQYKMLAEQNRFILFELRRINESARSEQLSAVDPIEADRLQTCSSFDYQWSDFHTGVAMSNDEKFMENLQSLICQITDLPRGWFSGKSAVDIGCGAGRFSFGLLSLGTKVTACDQSAAALQRVADLCRPYADRLSTRQIDLIRWDEEAHYDLGFCFGVVHHTGNTYLAIRNAARKVKPGGRLFLMVYGFPQTLSDFAEINSYEELRYRLRLLSFEERKKALIEQFGAHLAHGWFDASSPRLNDLLTFDEIAVLLSRLGFKNVKRTLPHRNHHLVADRAQ